MSTALATTDHSLPATIEQVLVQGDLSKLTPSDRLEYYKSVCESIGLNPLTRPFEYITLNGKLTFYARKDCTDQLRTLHGISISIPSREVIDGVYVVTAHAKRPDGRCDESTGAVPIDKVSGEAKANAFMKAETKAKRRVTLSICGLGMLDESEVDSIPGAVVGVSPLVAPKEAAKQIAECKIEETKAAPAEFKLPDYQTFEADIETANATKLQNCVAQLQHLLKETHGKVGEMLISSVLASMELPTWKDIKSLAQGREAALKLYKELMAANKAKTDVVPPEVKAIWSRLTDIASTVKEFTYLRELLGRHIGTTLAETEYRGVLSSHGVMHSNEFKGASGNENARSAARQLWELVASAEKADNDLLISDEDVPN